MEVRVYFMLKLVISDRFMADQFFVLEVLMKLKITKMAVTLDVKVHGF